MCVSSVFMTITCLNEPATETWWESPCGCCAAADPHCALLLLLGARFLFFVFYLLFVSHEASSSEYLGEICSRSFNANRVR